MEKDTTSNLAIDEYVLKSLNDTLDGLTVYQITCGERRQTIQNKFGEYDHNVADSIGISYSEYIDNLFEFGMLLHSGIAIFTSKKKALAVFDWVESRAVMWKLVLSNIPNKRVVGYTI